MRRVWTWRDSYFEDQSGFKVDAADIAYACGTTATHQTQWGTYLRIKRHRKMFYLHRLILGAKEGDVCDHINRDTKDNRRNNLRIVSPLVSTLNRGKQRDSTSRFHGVSWCRTQTRKRKTGKIYYYYRWRAAIAIGGKQRYSSTFKTEEEAAEAYNRAAIKFHGEHAKLNRL